MSWVKIESRFPQHPKVLTAGPEAAWLFVCGLCYANEHLTDGLLPRPVLPVLTPGVKAPETLAERLVDAGLWEYTENGWLIHDYADHQRSAEQIRAGLRADRERKRRQDSDGTPLRFRAESRRNPNGSEAESSRARTPAGGRERAKKEKEKEIDPPVVPPQAGGRQRDRDRWERWVSDYADEHFPNLPDNFRVRAVRQALRYGPSDDPSAVRSFIAHHWPELAGHLEAPS